LRRAKGWRTLAPAGAYGKKDGSSLPQSRVSLFMPKNGGGEKTAKRKGSPKVRFITGYQKRVIVAYTVGETGKEGVATLRVKKRLRDNTSVQKRGKEGEDQDSSLTPALTGAPRGNKALQRP